MRVFAVRLSAFGVGLVGGLLASLLLLHVALAANGGARLEGIAAASGTRIAGPPPLTLRLSGPVSEPQYDVYLPVVLREQ
jgi:hypothetical protein